MNADVDGVMLVLKPLVRPVNTDQGVRQGFLMADAEAAFGGLEPACAAMVALVAHGFVSCETFLMGDEVLCMYRLNETPRLARR